MNTMKIAIAGPLPPPAGGMAVQTQQLADLLKEQSVSVELIRTNRPYRPHFVGSLKGIRAVFRLLDYLVDIARVTARVDLVHLMANSGWSWHLFATPVVWIARMRKVPVVLNYRGGEAEQFFQKSWRWVKPTLNRVQTVVVPSGFLERVFQNREVTAQVIPNILQLDQFRNLRRNELNSESPHLIVTRNLEKLYGIDTALEAFALVQKEYPKVRLTIAGSGPEKSHLVERAKTLGVNESVRFAGRLDREEILDLYASADILLNPSLADNSPNSIIEALACGVPVVSSDVGGIPYLIQSGENGMLVKANDPAAMASSATEILQNKELTARLIEQGRQDVEKFDQERVIPQLMSLYERVLSL